MKKSATDTWGQLYARVGEKFIPVDVRRPGSPEKYPISKMMPGDSIFCPDKTAFEMRHLHRRARKYDIDLRMVTRVEEDENGRPVKGTRIWRIR